MLGSFTVQLTDHWLNEDLQAPPHLFHGFVGAPLYEYISLLLRLGVLASLPCSGSPSLAVLCRPELGGVWEEVHELREAALKEKKHKGQ